MNNENTNNDVTICLNMDFLREKDFKGLMDEIKKKIIEDNDGVNISGWLFLNDKNDEENKENNEEEE